MTAAAGHSIMAGMSAAVPVLVQNVFMGSDQAL